jgi:hypothetical protein
MSLFTPFAFIKEDGVWSPYLFKNITHYWRSDSNITLSGGNVTSWVDVLSGVNAVQFAGSTAPTYNTTDASFNNKPTVQYNGTTNALGASATSGYTSTDSMTVLAIHAPVKTGASTAQMLFGDSIGFMEMQMNSSLPGLPDILGTYKFNTGGVNGYVSTGVTYTNNQLLWQGAAISHSNTTFYQWVNSSTPVSTVTGQAASAGKDPFHPALGAYGAAGVGIGLYYPGKIMEAMFIKGVPSVSELNDFTTYVQNTYA